MPELILYDKHTIIDSRKTRKERMKEENVFDNH